jgi:hypothetical protein
MSVARGVLGFVGVVSIILALLGWWYNYTTMRVDFSQLQRQEDLPYFYQAFYTMSGICIVCYFVLFYVGVQMIRGKTDTVRLLTLLLLFEFLYSFAIGFSWTTPEYGMSIGAATGVANGGLMFQAFALFPLWAPIAAFFASRSIRRARGDEHAAFAPPLPITR